MSDPREISRKFSVRPIAIAALRFQFEQQQEHRRAYGAEYEDHGLVFCEPDRSYLQPDLVSQTIARRIKKAGMRGASLHTHGSNLLSKGFPLPTVSARSDMLIQNITARIYSHALPDDDSRAADAWEAVVTEPLNKKSKVQAGPRLEISSTDLPKIGSPHQGSMTFVTSCDISKLLQMLRLLISR